MQNPYNCLIPGGISTHRSTTSPPPVLLLLEILLLGRTPGQNNPHSSLGQQHTKIQGFIFPPSSALPGHSTQQSAAVQPAISLPLKLLLRKIFKIKIFLHFASAGQRSSHKSEILTAGEWDFKLSFGEGEVLCCQPGV